LKRQAIGTARSDPLVVRETVEASPAQINRGALRGRYGFKPEAVAFFDMFANLQPPTTSACLSFRMVSTAHFVASGLPVSRRPLSEDIMSSQPSTDPE
jgi:hypothetical protein